MNTSFLNFVDINEPPDSDLIAEKDLEYNYFDHDDDPDNE